MIDLNIILLLLSSAVLGVFLGAQIAELFLFVPIWKELDADEFFEQHEFVGPLIYRFFAPLTIAATVFPLMTAMLNLIYFSDEYFIFSIMGVSTLIFFQPIFCISRKLIRNLQIVSCLMMNYRLHCRSGATGIEDGFFLKL